MRAIGIGEREFRPASATVVAAVTDVPATAISAFSGACAAQRAQLRAGRARSVTVRAT